MKTIFVKYPIFVVLAILIIGPGGLARDVNPPEVPLTVPIGKSDKLWEMENLVPGKTGGEVSYVTENFPATFNNLLGKKEATKSVTKMIMGAGLTAENPVNGRIVPAFAKSWSTSENGLVYTFHLRDGLKFSDGHPLTAEDVVFTYKQLIFNSDVDTDRRELLRVGGTLPEIERVDKLTVRFRLPEPGRSFLRRLNTGIYPEHKLKGISGEEFNHVWGRKVAEENPDEIVGAGPFQLGKFVAGEEIVLTRNPYYYKVDPRGTQLPYLDRYRILKVKENEVEFLKFKSGETDFLRAQIQDMPFLINNADEEGWNLMTGEGQRAGPLNSDFLTFNWNTESKVLNDLFRESEFRKAVSLAINYTEIDRKIFNGFGQPQLGPISRLSPYHNPKMKGLLPTGFNPGTAREILNELGVKDTDENGVREFSSGRQARFSILINRGNRARKEMAEIIARNLEKVGLKVEVTVVGFDEYSSSLVHGNYQSTIARVMANAREPSTLSDIFATGGPLHLWNLGQGRELVEWENTIDRLLRRGEEHWTFQERKQYYYEFQSIFAEELPVIYLPGESFLYATDENVRNCGEFSRLGTFLDFAEFIWLEK